MIRQPCWAYGSIPSDTPHSVALLWTNDQSVVKTSTWQRTTLTRDRHPCRRRDSNPQPQQASNRRHHALDRETNGFSELMQLTLEII